MDSTCETENRVKARSSLSGLSLADVYIPEEWDKASRGIYKFLCGNYGLNKLILLCIIRDKRRSFPPRTRHAEKTKSLLYSNIALNTPLLEKLSIYNGNTKRFGTSRQYGKFFLCHSFQFGFKIYRQIQARSRK